MKQNPTSRKKTDILRKEKKTEGTQKYLLKSAWKLTDRKDDLVFYHVLELSQLLDLLGEVGDLLEVLLSSLNQTTTAGFQSSENAIK
jgi:hypothetical protein